VPATGVRSPEPIAFAGQALPATNMHLSRTRTKTAILARPIREWCKERGVIAPGYDNAVARPAVVGPVCDALVVDPAVELLRGREGTESLGASIPDAGGPRVGRSVEEVAGFGTVGIQVHR